MNARAALGRRHRLAVFVRRQIGNETAGVAGELSLSAGLQAGRGCTHAAQVQAREASQAVRNGPLTHRNERNGRITGSVRQE